MTHLNVTGIVYPFLRDLDCLSEELEQDLVLTSTL